MAQVSEQFAWQPGPSADISLVPNPTQNWQLFGLIILSKYKPHAQMRYILTPKSKEGH